VDNLRFLTAGESHGKALAGIIDQYPSGVEIDIDFINKELERRQKGFGRSERMDIEKDQVEIISGIRKGKTTGSPISFMISNKDWENWKEKLEVEPDLVNPRPGHADLAGLLKYNLDSIRDVIERSSARETATRVCTGAFANIALKLVGINIFSYVEQIGNVIFNEEIDISSNDLDWELIKKIEDSEVRCPDEKVSARMKETIIKAKEYGDTLGGKFKVIAKGLIPGLGSYIQWDLRLNAKIAAALMSIPAIKAVEIGDGFNSANRKGTDFHDEYYFDKKIGIYRKTNRAGGLEGGMTNGMPVVVGATMKPIPTTKKGLKSVNIKTKESESSLSERADICAVPSAAVVGEAMLATEILNAVQDKFGGDNIEEILKAYNNYKKYIKEI
jgi:chorismate synthase